MSAQALLPEMRRYQRSVTARLSGRQAWDRLSIGLAAAWVVAIALDASTTLLMMSSGKFDEANPVAALGMEHTSVLGYVIIASVISAAYALLGIGKPKHAATWAIVMTTAAACTYKLTVGVANLMLATTGWDLPLPL